MAYDASKDKLITDLGTIDVDSGTQIKVGLWQYNGGPEKYRAVKVTKTGVNIYRETILRASKSEWAAIVEAIKEDK